MKIFSLLLLWLNFSVDISQKLFGQLFFAGVINEVDQAKVTKFHQNADGQKMSDMIFHDFFLQLEKF